MVTFYVPIGSAKFTSQVQYKSDAPITAYQQQDQNSCCLSSLASDFKFSNEFTTENAITTHIYSLLPGTILDIV